LQRIALKVSLRAIRSVEELNRRMTAYFNCHYVKEDEAHRLSISNEGHNNTHTCHLGFEGNVSAFIYFWRCWCFDV